MRQLLLLGIVLAYLNGFGQDNEKPLSFHTSLGIEKSIYSIRSVAQNKDFYDRPFHEYNSVYNRLGGDIGLEYKKVIRLDIGTSVSDIKNEYWRRFFHYAHLYGIKNLDDKISLSLGFSYERYAELDGRTAQLSTVVIFQHGFGLVGGFKYRNAKLKLIYNGKYLHKGIDAVGSFDFAKSRFAVALSYDILNFPSTRKK